MENWTELPDDVDGSIVDVLKKIGEYIGDNGFKSARIFSDGSVLIATGDDPSDDLIHEVPYTFAIVLASHKGQEDG